MFEQERGAEGASACDHALIQARQQHGAFVSDSTELIRYLHLRAQEIGKQFRRCSFSKSPDIIKRSWYFLHKDGRNSPQNPMLVNDTSKLAPSNCEESHGKESGVEKPDGTLCFPAVLDVVSRQDNGKQLFNVKAIDDIPAQANELEKGLELNYTRHERNTLFDVQAKTALRSALGTFGELPTNATNTSGCISRIVEHSPHSNNANCNRHTFDAVMQDKTFFFKENFGKPFTSGEAYNQRHSVNNGGTRLSGKGNQSHMPSLSCVDSSECDNCVSDLSTAIVTDNATKCKFEEIDAMSEAGGLDVLVNAEGEGDKGDVISLKPAKSKFCSADEDKGALDLLLTAASLVLDEACVSSRVRKRKSFETKEDRLELCLCKRQERKKALAISAYTATRQEFEVLSRSGRSHVLPIKFSDSVLQPWKKACRSKQ